MVSHSCKLRRQLGTHFRGIMRILLIRVNASAGAAEIYLHCQSVSGSADCQ